VDFGTSEAKTTFGQIGVKVWVYHGDEVPHREQETERALARAHATAAQVDKSGRGGGVAVAAVEPVAVVEVVEVIEPVEPVGPVEAVEEVEVLEIVDAPAEGTEEGGDA
jgi:hypothetical protein